MMTICCAVCSSSLLLSRVAREKKLRLSSPEKAAIT